MNDKHWRFDLDSRLSLGSYIN